MAAGAGAGGGLRFGAILGATESPTCGDHWVSHVSDSMTPRLHRAMSLNLSPRVRGNQKNRINGIGLKNQFSMAQCSPLAFQWHIENFLFNFRDESNEHNYTMISNVMLQ
jgi:hypothetical protein